MNSTDKIELLFKKALSFFIVIPIFCFFNSNVVAQQPTQTIRGTVIDQYSQSPLPGATVVLLQSDPPTGTVTDIDGKFRLEKVPVGRAGIQVTYIGYNPTTLNNLQLSSGKETVLNIELEEKVITGKEIEIVATQRKEETINEMAIISSRTFSIEESKRYAGTLNDVSRMASNYAGAQSHDDSRNDIVIRGNSPLGVLYRLEGIDIPNPNHFGAQGTTGGPISMLNNNVLENSDFLTGAFPAEYGNALAGVFDLQMRNGNNQQHEFVGQVGFNGAEMLAEGPFNKKSNASYLLSYRYSTLDLFKLMGISFGTLSVPRYQDLSFKLNFPHKKGTTSIFGIGGISNIELLDSDIPPEDNIFGQEGEDIYYGTKMATSGILHKYLLNNTSYLKAGLAMQLSTNFVDNDTLDSNRVPHDYYDNTSLQGKATLSFAYNKKISTRHQLRTGFFADHLFFNLKESIYRAEIDSFVDLTNFDGGTQLIRPYVQWQFRATNDLTFIGGVYYQHFLLNNTYSVEPRGAVKWQINPLNSISMGYGLHSQLQPTSVYFEQIVVPNGDYYTPNRNTEMTKSHHIVLGYDKLLAERIRVKLETYYQDIFNAPVDVNNNSYSMLNQGADFGIGFPDTLTNGGSGTNYGIELTLEQFLHKGFYFLLTGSLFESKYKGSDGIERNTAFNTNYNLNLLLGKEFELGNKKKDEAKRKKQQTLFLDVRFAMIGGKPYTPIDIEASNFYGTQIRDFDNRFSSRYKEYLRFDFKMGFRINGQKVTHEWAFNLQNATDHKNVFNQTYNTQNGKIETTHQIGILPIVQYRIEF